jgi:hypothetical protein
MRPETVNFHAQEVTRPHQAVVEPRHRVHESHKTNRAMRAAKYLLRRGHAPRHAAPVPEAQRPVEQVKLQYQGAKAERLVSASIPDQKNMYTGTRVDVTSHMPLLTRERVREQLGGMEMGALQAVVRLPGSKDPLYCFNQSHYDQEGNLLSGRYAIISGTQLSQLRDAALNHKPERWDEVNEGILYLDAKHTSKTVGSKRWLPGRVPFPDPEATQVVPAPGTPASYSKISEKQAKFFLNPYGRLIISDQAPKHPTTVEYTPAYVPAVDPWPNGANAAIDQNAMLDPSVAWNMPTRENATQPIPVPHQKHQ